MTGTEYLLNRIAELELAVATLIDQKAAVEKERDGLKMAQTMRRRGDDVSNEFEGPNKGG